MHTTPYHLAQMNDRCRTGIPPRARSWHILSMTSLTRRSRGFAHALVYALLVSSPLLAQRGGGRGNAVSIQDGQQCPPGMTEIRPRSCMAPENPPPSILDYRPKSTLVTAAHLKPRAKYSAIDYHGHPGQLIMSAQGLDSLGRALDALNVREMISADNLSGQRLRTALAAIKASDKMRDRVRVLAGIDFRNVGPGWAQKAIAQLHADLAAGAVGVGEISKSFGL